jgi:diadenosine tetraphosphatase ApaH/serine/threonine PP2A family protein phosphatase
VRYLLLSDIHANWDALEACLADASGAWDTAVCCGDLVGYGPDPDRVVTWARPFFHAVIRGNHDRACSGTEDLEWFNPTARAGTLWTTEHLSAENLTWLRELPRGPLPVNGFDLTHGSPLDEDEYITSRADAENIYDYLDSALTFFGHTHLQGGFLWANGHQEAIQRPGPRQHQVHLRLDRDGVYLLNPGSVGQPRDGDPRAAYALYDTESREVTFRRVQYDAFKVRQRIEAAGLPAILGDRLLLGR